MVDTREAMESEYVSVDLIKSSPTQKLVVTDPGNYEETDFGRRLTLGVNVDGKQKKWRPNKESVENLQAYGTDSTQWLSKMINLTIEKRSGKECVIARPEQGEVVKTEAVIPQPQQEPVAQEEVI